MTVYTGRTFQTCALRVWGVWVSMRDFHAATARTNAKSDCRSLNDFFRAICDKDLKRDSRFLSF